MTLAEMTIILVSLALIVGNYSGAVIVAFWLRKKMKQELGDSSPSARSEKD